MRRLLSCRGHLPSFTPGMAGRRSRRNGCFGGAAAGAGRSMRALSRLADVAGFWTLDRTTITGRSAVILRQHTTPFRPMIVPLDDLELVLSKLEKSKPLHTRKFPRVSAQDSRLGPIQPWDVKDFLRLDRGLTPFFGSVIESTPSLSSAPILF